VRVFCTTATSAALLALSITANAAEVGAEAPAYVPPAPVPAPFSWTGLYGGLHLGGAWGGGAWGQNALTDSLFNLSFGSNGGVPILGGQLGFNYQYGNFVVGVEGDFSMATNYNNGVVVPGVGTIQVISESRWISTAAARFGVTYDNWLFYGKTGGGWAFGKDLTLINPVTGAAVNLSSNGNGNSGLLAGAGIELAISPQLSAKIEYDYLRLNSRTFNIPPGSLFLVGDTFITSNPNVQMVKAGLNYLFNWPRLP
jgi:outer membrane immunogenic protein